MALLTVIGLSVVALALCVHLLRQFWFAKHINKPYPPGPKGTFWRGNLKDIPKSNVWFTYTSWKKQYDDLVHLRVFGQHMVIVNSHEATVELFEKRGGIYSDRPYMPILEMMGWGLNSGFIQYSDRWRLHRRIYQQFLTLQKVSRYRPIQIAKVQVMLKNLLKTPKKFADHYTTLSAGIIVKTIYDIDINPEDDPYVELAEGAINKLNEGVVPVSMQVYTMPVLRHIFPRLPGTYFKRFIEEARDVTDRLLTVPFEIAQKNTDPFSSVAKQLLEKSRSRGGGLIEERAIQEVCATGYAAGVETTSSVMGTFFYAMLLFPEVQRKAQMEINDIIGTSRLPDYDDKDSLPYVEAVVREVMRWRPALPIGVAHATISDDVYQGYFIPKGATIIPNVWAMTRDEIKYPNPEEFKPERFFKENGQLNDDTVDINFGFGRRICPGRHMARATVWFAIAATLSVFNIRKAKDESGNEIPVSGKYSNGIISLHYWSSLTSATEAVSQTWQF